MQPPTRLLMMSAFAFVISAASPSAQGPVDPSGHWHGSVSAPDRDLQFDLDLQRSRDGRYAGTVDIPGERIAGLPLRQVVVNGTGIEFNARTDQTFRGEIADDGQSISGTFSVEGASLPFSIARTGAARAHTAATGSPIAKEFEGTWNGRMASNGKRLVLHLANHADGTSTAAVINMDEGGLQIPGTPTQNGASITILLPIVGGSYVATLSDDGTALVGTYSQGERSTPLTFTREHR